MSGSGAPGRLLRDNVVADAFMAVTALQCNWKSDGLPT